ncbi:MAG TPA: rhodanese-like domain-containing protein [Luteimonas sp.]|nr:rhodanese-like domain-containing protein [Luteimonas sp.]
MSFVAELNQRKVFRVAALYLIVAWVAVQAASIALPAFDAPGWVLRVVILLFALGLPIALMLTWALEMTPAGVTFEPTRMGNKRMWLVSGGLAVLAAAWYFLGQPATRVQPAQPSATQVQPVRPSAEVSTQQLKRILAQEQAIVLDTRPHLEFAISHIPGALNVAARPGIPMSMYESDVAEVSRLVGGDLKRALVLYCNGPLCPKSKRLSNELEAAGYTNVRRYQLGIPVWRAFGGVTVIEADGLRHVLSLDRTAVVIDVRENDAFQRGTLPGARNVPRSVVLEGRDVGELRKAKDDGRLPMTDHNTRIIVIGRTAGDARFVAQAIAHEAFHNVAYFPGTFEEASVALVP